MTSVPTSVQALTVVLVLLTALYMQYSFKPYSFSELNHMETEALFTASITIYCGLYYLTSFDNQSFKMFLFILILLGNVYFILYWVYYMVQAGIDMVIKVFPQLRNALKRGDGFDEDFFTEEMHREGCFMNFAEGRTNYTFLKYEKPKYKPLRLHAHDMEDVYKNVL